MKDYYTLKLSTDAKKIGCFPQVDCNTQFHAHQLKYGRFPDFNPELSFELEKKAKLTEVLSQASISANGLLINERVKVIFEKYELIDHRFFPAPVKDQKGKIHSYYWLHMVAKEEYFHWIDFTNSRFLLEIGIRNFKPISINSKEEYDQKLREADDMADDMDTLADIVVDKIACSPSFNKKLSLFVFPKVDIRIFVSNDLKEELISSGVTGIEFTEAPL